LESLGPRLLTNLMASTLRPRRAAQSWAKDESGKVDAASATGDTSKASDATSTKNQKPKKFVEKAAATGEASKADATSKKQPKAAEKRPAGDGKAEKAKLGKGKGKSSKGKGPKGKGKGKGKGSKDRGKGKGKKGGSGRASKDAEGAEGAEAEVEKPKMTATEKRKAQYARSAARKAAEAAGESAVEEPTGEGADGERRKKRKKEGAGDSEKAVVKKDLSRIKWKKFITKTLEEFDGEMKLKDLRRRVVAEVEAHPSYGHPDTVELK